LELSGALGFADTKLLNTAQGVSHEVEKMLFALLGNLKNNSSEGETSEEVRKTVKK
jgi:hypothetical protein